MGEYSWLALGAKEWPVQKGSKCTDILPYLEMAWDIQGGYAVPNMVLNYGQRTRIDTVFSPYKKAQGKTFTTINP